MERRRGMATRLYFGADTTNYFFLTPLNSVSGVMRFAITTSGSGGEQVIDAPIALPTNQWCHVAVTLDGSKGLLYLNGNPVGTNYSPDHSAVADPGEQQLYWQKPVCRRPVF